MLKATPLRALLTACTLLAATGLAAAPLTFDTNRQVFLYNGRTLALVGASGEYLCHVDQSGTGQPDREAINCTWKNNPTFLSYTAGKGLNKIRMWVGLNHSPGTHSPNPVPNLSLTPYPFEQPFVFNTDSTSPNFMLWNLDAWEETYFTRVFKVIQAAAATNPPIMVEVTLFDAEGVWENGPWNDKNNTQNATHSLTDQKYFLAYDNKTNDLLPGNVYVRGRQRDFIRKMAGKLNTLDNFYWEMANEPDLATGSDTVATRNWHADMVTELVNAEAVLPKKHLIAVNFATDVPDPSDGSPGNITWAGQNANVRLISGHYASTNDARFGAEELVRKYLQPGAAGSINKAFGFNEDWYTPGASTVDSVRVEAWEFLINEGGSFDHLGYNWNVGGAGSVPDTVRTQLGNLAYFLNGKYDAAGNQLRPPLPLRNLGRVQADPSSWCPNAPIYASPTMNGTVLAYRTYTASMQWADNDYLLYIHHSIADNEAIDPLNNNKKRVLTRYMPVSGSYTNTLQVKPGAAGTYVARWINPATGTDFTCQGGPCPNYPFQFAWAGNQASVQNLPLSPAYPIDAVLRVTRVP